MAPSFKYSEAIFMCNWLKKVLWWLHVWQPSYCSSSLINTKWMYNNQRNLVCTFNSRKNYNCTLSDTDSHSYDLLEVGVVGTPWMPPGIPRYWNTENSKLLLCTFQPFPRCHQGLQSTSDLHHCSCFLNEQNHWMTRYVLGKEAFIAVLDANLSRSMVVCTP